MADFNKYIGIPYVNHGRDQSGSDCFGIVKMILEKEFKVDVPEWIDQDEPDFSRFKKADEPEVGSIGLFKFAGVPAHVGIYIGDGRVLHVMPNETACAEKLKSRRLDGKLDGWYNAE